jgi:hypothetical protein
MQDRRAELALDVVAENGQAPRAEPCLHVLALRQDGRYAIDERATAPSAASA